MPGAEGDSVEGLDLEALAGLALVDRRPIAAVPIQDTLAVVCDDGACFKRTAEGWLEIEPVPGTVRAETWEPDEPTHTVTVT